MGYGDVLPVRGAAGTTGHFAHHDPIRTTHNAFTYVSASVTETTFGGGADPTGVADSASAISACWTAAAPYTTIIYPPASSGQATYKITTALNHPNKPLFHYSPRGAAVIKNTGTGPCIETNGADSWIFDGLVFDTNYPTRTTGRGLVVSGGSTNWRVERCRFQNIAEMALTISNAQDFWIHNNFFTNISKSCIWMGEGTGAAVEYGDIGHNTMEVFNESDSPGHSGIQCNSQNPGLSPNMAIRRMKIHNNTVRNYSGWVGYGLDLIMDSDMIANHSYGEHPGEAMAVCGARNRVIGGRLGEATGAAGLLLWTYVGNDQDNKDTIISDVYLPGPAGGGNQGVAIVPAENNVAFSRINVHDIRSHGWNYGIQQYLSGKTGVTMAATVVVHDNHLSNNSVGATLFDTSGATLRNNQS